MGIGELTDFLPGTSWNSHRQSGYYRTRLLEDGRYHNTLLARGEVNLDSHGYWYVDPEGRACSKPALDHPKVKPMCSYWFKSGEHYFVGAGKEHGNRVFPRKVLRHTRHRPDLPNAASSLSAAARKPEPSDQHGSGPIGWPH